MPINSLFSRATNSAVVLKRFWALLLLVLVLAVISSALAVRFTATPFLVTEQREAITAQASKDARALETTLARHRLLLEFISHSPAVVDVVMGYVENGDVVANFLRRLAPEDALSSVHLYDAFGEEISRFDGQPDHSHALDEAAFNQLIASIAAEEDAAERRVVFKLIDDKAYIALATPVRYQGLTEGVVASVLHLDLAEVFPTNDVAQRTFIVDTADLENPQARIPEHASIVALQGSNLSVVLVPDRASVEAAGQRLLTNVVSVLSLVLVGAFGVFAALGRAALVEPHKRLEEQKQSLSELAAVAKRANDAFVVTDAFGCVVWTNPSFEQLTGYTSEEVCGCKPGKLLQGEDTDPNTVEEIRVALRRRTPIKTEILNYSKEGNPYWVSLGISPLRNEQGEFYGFMAISHDITQERAQREAILEAKREIEHQALHDALTELPNRRALDIALRTRSTSNEPGATVVRIDLDHFKYVNDTLGHAAGDFVLCEVAHILREETKSEDLPARVGGDEFVILLGAGKTSEDGKIVAERMLERIQQPKQFEKKTVRVGASFGVASTLDGLLPVDQLIVGADAALYEAKDSGRNAVKLYTPQLHHIVQGRRSLALEIRRAILNEEFVPYFQPQIDANSHEIVGVETLARWHSPELGVMSPDTFLPIAEQLSAVDEIDALIFRKAIDQISALRDRGVCIPKVSFNVTAQRIQNPDMFLDLPNAQNLGFEIAFEILESVLVEEQTDLFIFSIDRLREMGISIEIDDFGSGHASIVGLMHLRPDVMKIDQRLVMPVNRSDTIRGLLQQIIGMADLMGLKVTAEGVETLEHAQILKELGCHTLQGYAFAKPKPVDDLYDFAMNWSPRRQSEAKARAQRG